MDDKHIHFDIKTHQFDVAFSFPGEYREYVRDVFDSLSLLMECHHIFYDDYYKSFLAVLSLDSLLQDIYKNRTKLNVVFLCEEYQKKEWCGLEARALRTLIKNRDYEKIMPVRIGDGEVEGFYETDGYIDARRHKPAEIASFIHQRLTGTLPALAPTNTPTAKSAFPTNKLSEAGNNEQPLGYIINIGTTSCRLFQVIDSKNLKEIAVKSYNISNEKDFAYLDGIIYHVKNDLFPQIPKNQSSLLLKVYVDYQFDGVFESSGGLLSEEVELKRKEFIKEFYTQTRLFFNILSKDQTIENLKRIFDDSKKNKVAIIVIGSRYTDVVYRSGDESRMYSLDVTLEDIEEFVERKNFQEVWTDENLNEIQNYIREKMGHVLQDIEVDAAIIMKGELTFMKKLNYPLLPNAQQHFYLSQTQYKDHNRKKLFKTDYMSELIKISSDKSMCNRFYRFKFGHIIIETILDQIHSKQVFPRDELSIHGLNSYIFNVVICGSTRFNPQGVLHMFEAHNMITRMGANVLFPGFTEDGTLEKDISSDTQFECLKAIDGCDVLFVCNKGHKNYVGGTTKCEIFYAYALQKTIAFWREPPEDKQLSFIPSECWEMMEKLI